MKKALIVTGSVGSGKTIIAKELAKKINYKFIDLNGLIKQNKLQGKYIKKLDTYEVDINKLNKFLDKLIKESKENLIIDSHMSHYLRPETVGLCVVCKCELKELKRRLEARGYSKEKIRINLDAEIFDVCLVEATERKHHILIVDTTKESADKIVNRIIKKIKA